MRHTRLGCVAGAREATPGRTCAARAAVTAAPWAYWAVAPPPCGAKRARALAVASVPALGRSYTQTAPPDVRPATRETGGPDDAPEMVVPRKNGATLRPIVTPAEFPKKPAPGAPTMTW